MYIRYILNLLRILGAANVPTSWWKCKKLLNTQPTGRLNAKKRSIRPSCNQMSGKIDCCTECDTNYTGWLKSFESKNERMCIF